MKVRYLVKFTKESEIKFVGHLDLMRTIQRTVKRSGLPVAYSEGFNPHVSLSLAQPLAVGVYSSGDYFDVRLLEDIDESEVINAIQKAAPSGIKILDAVKIFDRENKKAFKSMAVIGAAEYRIRMRYVDVSTLEKEMKTLLESRSWKITKKSKSGEREVDIKPMIKNIDFKIEGNILEINAMINCGSSENLSPELLAKYIKKHTSNCDLEAFTDIRRNEMYALRGNDIIPLYKYASLF